MLKRTIAFVAAAFVLAGQAFAQAPVAVVDVTAINILAQQFGLQSAISSNTATSAAHAAAQTTLLGTVSGYSAVVSNNTTQSLAKQAEQLDKAAKQLDEQVKAGKKLDNHPDGKLAEMIRDAYELMQGVQGASYLLADVDTKYRERNPDYAKVLADQLKGKSKTEVDAFFADRSKRVGEEFVGQTAQRLKALGVLQKDLQSEKALVDTLLAHSQSAEGQMQVLQVANVIAAQSTYAQQKMQMLLAQVVDSQTAWYTYQREKDLVAESRTMTSTNDAKAIKDKRKSDAERALGDLETRVNRIRSGIPATGGGN